MSAFRINRLGESGASFERVIPLFPGGSMDELFALFCKEKEYLKGVSPQTVRFYQHSYSAFKRYHGEASKTGLNRFVLEMRESGMKVGSVNAFIRGMNSFLSWLHENQHITEKLKIKLLREDKRVLKTFSDLETKKLITFRPRGFADTRLHAMVCLMIDTGVRIKRDLHPEGREGGF